MLSIIIPVYNAEKYLKECINSVLRQKLEDYEVILVDDGSTDSSLKICRSYESKNSRIKVLHQTNQGVSSARNSGIKQANGDWLTFIDSDDVIDDTFFLHNNTPSFFKVVSCLKVEVLLMQTVPSCEQEANFSELIRRN